MPTRPQPARKHARSVLHGAADVLATATALGLVRRKSAKRKVSARIDGALMTAAKRRTGVASDSALLTLAVANLAVADEFGAWVLRPHDRLDPDFKLVC
jgi:hypothetical protein